MTVLVWTESARRDLRAIRSYVSRDSKTYAKRLIDRIRRKAEGVLRLPRAAAIVPEWGRENVRETFVANYRVIYRIRDDFVEVLAVIHAARLLPDADDVVPE